jgi:methylglutamate dehydrogenase subunit A
MSRNSAQKYSAMALLRGAFNGQSHWKPAWRDPEPKSSYDIIIIGGGGHGLATAYYLAKVHGLRNIAVLEKGYIGSGNTGRNTTIVRSNYRLAPLHNLFEFGLKMWEHLSDELNYNVMFSPRGSLTLGHSDADMTMLAQRGDAMRCDGIDAELMTRDQVAKFEPLLDMSRTARFPIEGAMIQPRGGTARHDAVAWGYARGADSLGVDIIQKCEVTGFVRDGGAVVGVETTRGRIGAGRVGVCVAGNSGHVAGLAGLKLPIESQTLQAMVTEGVKPMINSVIQTQSLHCYISQSDKGGIVFGGDPDNWPSYAQRGNPMIMQQAIAQGLALVPALSRLRMLRTWSGVTDMSFDGSPIIGETPVKNLYLNGGWCYGGFKATPASGWTYAHTLATGKPHELNAPFALDRFTSGATIDENGSGPMPNSR